MEKKTYLCTAGIQADAGNPYRANVFFKLILRLLTKRFPLRGSVHLRRPTLSWKSTFRHTYFKP